ncbi:hypothetical protein BSKO_13826 [Bryopsis sp. KO-2023]|nr:hypothetical protein BSKO_13826 [Bryopsis sp. KO-2023]
MNPEVHAASDHSTSEQSRGAEQSVDLAPEDDGSERVDLVEFGVQQALPVEGGEPDWDSGPATTVEEYLKRVRWEASRCEQTTRADIDPQQFDEHRTEYFPREDLPECSEGRKPTVRWMVGCLEDFKKLRQAFEELDNADEDENEELPIGVLIQVDARLTKNTTDADSEVLSCLEENRKPQLMEVQQLGMVETVDFLQAHVDNLLVQPKENTIRKIQAIWLYALMARLHKPVPPDISCTLLSLLRFCLKARANTGEEKLGKVLPLVNLMIVVCGVYFGQDETLAGLIDVTLD